MRMSVGIAVASAVIALSAQAALAQSQAPPSRLMTPEVIKRAGLEKLSIEERRYLDSWIAAYASVVGGGGGQTGTVESKIDGEFEGWDGETIFKLMNGQIWQQSSYDYEYHYAYSPDVVIYPSGSGFKMKVEGVNDAISVRRLK